MVVESMLKYNQLNNSSLRSKMGMAYLLLDFSPSYREKVNYKSNFTNMYTDSEHMLNASFAKYYITQDKKAIRKTKFVYNTLDVGTEVYNIDEFTKLFELHGKG